MPVNDVKAVKRLATIEFLKDQELVDELLERFAEGEGTLKQLCAAYELVYPTTLRYLNTHHRADYESAKAVRADLAIDEMAEVERRLESSTKKEGMDFNSARELFKSKQWRAERLNPGRYSPKQTVDMQVTDKTKLHLDAIRRMTQITVKPAGPALPAPAEALPSPGVVDAEYVEVKQE